VTRPTWRARHPRIAAALPLAIAGVLLAGGGFAGGVAAGWSVAARALLPASAERATPAPVRPDVVNASVVMPDVRGLGPDEAQQVIADAGIDVATVTVTSQPAAGPSGVIVAQTPAFGAVQPAKVTLIVSAPAAVPDAIGKDAAPVLAELDGLGAQIRRTGVYIPGTRVGTVTAISPAAGSPLPHIVDLTVTAAPTTIALGALGDDGDCRRVDAPEMDSRTWTDAIACDSSAGGDTSTWTFNGRVGDVTGTLGISDDSEAGSTATVVLLADGRPVGSYVLRRGQSTAFTVTVSGATTFSIASTSTSSGSGSGSGSPPTVIAGGLLARGSSADISALSR
jgi:hypothetical protein